MKNKDNNWITYLVWVVILSLIVGLILNNIFPIKHTWFATALIATLAISIRLHREGTREKNKFKLWLSPTLGIPLAIVMSQAIFKSPYNNILSGAFAGLGLLMTILVVRLKREDIK